MEKVAVEAATVVSESNGESASVAAAQTEASIVDQQPGVDGEPPAQEPEANSGNQPAATTTAEAVDGMAEPKPVESLLNNRGAPADDSAFLLSKGIDQSVVKNMLSVFKAGIVERSALDERTLELIVSMRPEHASHVFQQFYTMSLYGVKNRPAYLNALLKHFRDRLKTFGEDGAYNRALMTTPKEEDVKTLVEGSGYDLEVTIGQRKYSAPSEEEQPSVPSPGCEVYVGKIPKTVFETDLVPLFEQCGKIKDMRIMMDPVSGIGKGYGFVTFSDRQAASEAAKKFEGYEIRPGKRLRVNVSIANTRLFVGNIPKSKGKEEILDEFSKLAGVTNIADVIMYPYPNDPMNKKNRGFCFLDFADHKSASQAKRRLSNSRFRPWNMEVVVEWAETQDQLPDGADGKNKTLYVRPLKESVTEEVLKERFGTHGRVERVKRIKDYAFVHFASHDEAAKAMEAMKGQQLDGVPCEISFAKPPSDKNRRRKDTSTRTGSSAMSSSSVGGQGHHRPEPFINPFESRSMYAGQHQQHQQQQQQHQQQQQQQQPQQGTFSPFAGSQMIAGYQTSPGTPYLGAFNANPYCATGTPDFYGANAMNYGSHPISAGPMIQHPPVNMPMAAMPDMRLRSPMSSGYGGQDGGNFFGRPNFLLNYSGGGNSCIGGDLGMTQATQQGSYFGGGSASGRAYKRKMPSSTGFHGNKRRNWHGARRFPQ